MFIVVVMELEKEIIEQVETEPKSEVELVLEEIRALESDKKEFIDKVKKFNESRRLKSIEIKAMEPYLTEKKSVSVGPLLRILRKLEFRLSQIINPKSEKDVVKQIQKVEKELKVSFKIEHMRKRKKYLEKDVEKIDKSIEIINTKLSKIRSQLKERREFFKNTKKKSKKKLRTPKKEDEYICIKDLAEIKKKRFK